MKRAFGYAFLIIGIAIGIAFLPLIFDYWNQLFAGDNVSFFTYVMRAAILLGHLALPLILIVIGIRRVMRKTETV